MLKIIEDELIVGIVTETNQFIQVDPPIPNDIDDGMDVLYATGHANNGYVEADKELAVNRQEDQLRLDTIRNIKLEGQFYSAFRTTLRVALSRYDNYDIRDQIINILGNKQFAYQIALNKMELLLRHVL